MKVTVKRWGNSAAVRIPASVVEAMNLNLDETVDLRVARGRIVIEPIRQKEYDLDSLVKRITPENRHALSDTGPAVGNEVW